MLLGCLRGAASPSFFFFPLSFEGEGDTGGEVDKKEILRFAQNDRAGGAHNGKRGRGIKGDGVNRVKPEGCEVDKFPFSYPK